MTRTRDEHAEVPEKLVLDFFVPLLVPCGYLLHIFILCLLIPQT